MDQNNYISIITDRLNIVPLSLQYAESTWKYSSNPENTEYMVNLPNETREELMDFLQNVERSWALPLPRCYEFAILLEDGTHIGGFSVTVDFSKKQGELGWIIAKDFWRQGYATEAALAIMAYFKERVGIKSFIANCDSENVGSYKTMEKIGMKRVSCTPGRKNKYSEEDRENLLYECAV